MNKKDDLYEKAKRKAAASARQIAFGHWAQQPGPRGEAAQDAFDRDLNWDDDDDDGY